MTTTETEQLSLDALWRSLEETGAIDDLGLDPAKLGTLTYDEWAALGAMFGRRNSAVRWALGDWINFGESTYGEAIWQAVDVSGLREQTIKNYAWVAGSVGRSRRRDTLSWSHHEAVASLPPREQLRWLSKAEAEGMTVEVLREAVRDRESGDSGGGESGEDRLTIAEAARQVWLTSSKHGETYHVPVEPMLRLARAMGEPV